MFPIFQHSLARSRGSILGWGITLLLIGLMVTSIYDVVLSQQEQFEQLLKNYPPEFSAFFGDFSDFTSPEGFLSAEFFAIMPVVLGVFAILAGSGLLVGDEENGTLDLLLAYPVSRTALFLGRLLAFVTATAAILVIGWLGLAVSTSWTALDVGPVEMALPFLGLLAQLLLTGTLALLLSMALPSRRLAAMVGGLVLVAGFFVTSLARINEELAPLARLSPLNYYQSGNAILGLNWTWFAGLMAVAALFALLAWWRFERRDIRVGGEGGWRMPQLRRQGRTAA